MSRPPIYIVHDVLFLGYIKFKKTPFTLNVHGVVAEAHIGPDGQGGYRGKGEFVVVKAANKRKPFARTPFDESIESGSLVGVLSYHFSTVHMSFGSSILRER